MNGEQAENFSNVLEAWGTDFWAFVAPRKPAQPDRLACLITVTGMPVAEAHAAMLS